MDAIILSRRDAELISMGVRVAMSFEGVRRVHKILDEGSAGYSWVQSLPDLVLQDMEYYYDPEPNDDDRAPVIYDMIVDEIERRENSKPTNVTTSN